MGGIQKKLFKMCTALVVAAVLAFSVVGGAQLLVLSTRLEESEQGEITAIKELSGETMKERASEILLMTIDRVSEIAESEFWTFRHDFTLLRIMVEEVFRHPERFDECDISLPKKENAGKYTAQLLLPDGKTLPTGWDYTMIRKLANLTPLMEEIVRGNTESVIDCFISLPSGYTIAVDALSDGKFLEDGSLQPYDGRDRLWFRGAEKKKDLYYGPATSSYFYESNVKEITYGLPVYVDDELVAVLQGSINVTMIQKVLGQVELGEGSFFILVNDRGQIIYSPRKKGELAMDDEFSSNVLDGGNEELNELIQCAMEGISGFDEVKVDGEMYYCAFEPVEALGGMEMIFMPVSQVEKPTNELLASLDEVQQETKSSVGRIFGVTVGICVLLAILLTGAAAVAAFNASRRMTQPIRTMTEEIEDVSGDDIDFSMQDIYRTGDEIEVLAEAFESLSERMKGYVRDIVRITSERERIEAELDVAAAIQMDMMPGPFPLYPDRPEFDVYGTVTPAKEVGGDFYDAFLIDADHLCLVVADVSGKGISAALFMVVAKTTFENRALLGGKPSEILFDVNNHLAKGNRQMMFVTVWLAIVTLSTGEVVEANAGHENPAISRAGGGFELIQKPHQLVLGVRPNTSYEDDVFYLGKGDRLFVYTDGLPEATNAEDKRFEEERMLEALDAYKGDDLDGILSHMYERVDHFVGDAPQFDDLTMMVMRYNGKE